MEEKTWTLRPNFLKALGYVVLKLVLMAAGFVGLLYFLSSMGIFSILKETAESLGVNLPAININLKLVFGIAFFVIVAILVAINYASLKNLQYIFEKDHLIITKNIGIVKLSEENIHYDNITRITFDKITGADKVFGTYTITLELTGTRKKSTSLEYLDDGEKTAGYIQWIIDNHKQQKIKAQIHEKKITDIIDGY